MIVEKMQMFHADEDVPPEWDACEIDQIFPLCTP